MGGLFGMAVFGNKYGQEYKVQASVSGDLEVECSASVKVTMEGTTEVVHVSAGADTPRPKSRSGSCQSEAAEAKLVEEAASVAVEAATIEPTPGKAISRDVKETAPIEPEEAVQRAFPPPPVDPAHNISMCSGALPVQISGDVDETAPIEPIQRALSPPPADPAALIEPVPAGEASEDGYKTAPTESEEAIQRALSLPAADLADRNPLYSGALPIETSENVDETTPVESEETIQRALSPPPGDPADDIPLCSGALPVENELHTPHEDDPPVHHSQEDKKEHDAASEGGKE
ncbi:hypothetical protein G6514_005842 [Epicoccum nigrum]|nr:hypothetical protein G6514_005842 [Epicoccum nigrum]